MKRRTVLRTQRVKRRKKGLRPLKILWTIFSSAMKLVVLLFFLAGISLFFTYSYHYFVNSPLLKLEHVEIRGANASLKKRIMEVCHLSANTSLLTLRLDEIRQIIEREPWVRSARVERRFPHKLIIDVEMEHPYALVLLDGLYYMNRWGEVFKQLEEKDSADYPVITGISGPGAHIQRQLKTAAHVIGALAKNNEGSGLNRLSEVHVVDDEHLSLYFSEFPAEVQITVGNFKLELEKLKRIVKHLKSTGRIQMVSRINLDSRVGAVVSFERG